MTARKSNARGAATKPATTAATEEPATPTPAVAEQPAAAADEGQAQELAWCRIGRDLEDDAPECPRHEFEPGARLCNLHFVTRLDLREVARNDG
ncbi:hypothetical protein GCM10027258_57810 [Amycolatopsis stemonae]